MECDMTTSERIRDAVYAAIDEMNQQLPEQTRLTKSPETVLMGESSQLDSLQMISLIITIEQEIERMFQTPIDLAGGEILASGESGPASTVQALIQYISEILSREHHVK